MSGAPSALSCCITASKRSTTSLASTYVVVDDGDDAVDGLGLCAGMDAERKGEGGERSRKWVVRHRCSVLLKPFMPRASRESTLVPKPAKPRKHQLQQHAAVLGEVGCGRLRGTSTVRCQSTFRSRQQLAKPTPANASMV